MIRSLANRIFQPWFNEQNSTNFIWALARNGSGALWTLSSSMNRSDFAFERPIDKFYQARPRTPRASASSRQRLNTKNTTKN